MIEKRFVHQFTQSEWIRAIGPALVPAANGDWLCAWVAGKLPDSDSQPGLSAVYRRSSDYGQTWSDLAVWFTTPDPDRCAHAHPNYVAPDGALIGFGLTFDAMAGRMPRRRPVRLVSRDHGLTWDPPQPMHDRFGVVTRAGRVVLDNGDWLFAQHYLRPVGVPLGQLDFPEEIRQQRDASDWRWGVNVLISTDQGQTYLPFGFHEEPPTIQEPHAIQLRDGTVVLLCRVNRDGFLWRADSHDNGRTWTTPVRTDIPNPGSKVWLTRLTDGRIALVHNPSSTARDPLHLWLSEDEMRTWPTRIHLDSWEEHAGAFTAREGAGKSTSLAYPHALEHQGALHVVYDLGRRDIVHLLVDVASL